MAVAMSRSMYEIIITSLVFTLDISSIWRFPPFTLLIQVMTLAIGTSLVRTLEVTVQIRLKQL